MSSFNYTIAIDAMGGENSPDKIIEGLSLFLNDKQLNLFFSLSLTRLPKADMGGI